MEFGLLLVVFFVFFKRGGGYNNVDLLGSTTFKTYYRQHSLTWIHFNLYINTSECVKTNVKQKVYSHEDTIDLRITQVTNDRMMNQ